MNDTLLIRRTPQNSSTIAWAVRRGRLVRILPGVYAAEDSPAIRLHALMEKSPSAVVVGRMAAKLLWWPELEAMTITAARRGSPAPATGFTWTRSMPPDSRVTLHDGVRLPDVAYSVIELIPELGGEVIDQALRRRAATLPELWDALRDVPHRPGNIGRVKLLIDSRSEPWSEAERELHRILRSSDFPWAFTANHPVVTDRGLKYLDVAIRPLCLGLEVDGYRFHQGQAKTTQDLLRDLALARAGWENHHFPAQLVFDAPDEVLRTARRLVELRARQRGHTLSPAAHPAPGSA